MTSLLRDSRQDQARQQEGRPSMIADLRIYTTLPSRMAEFVTLYEEKAWPLQLKYLENCLGWYTTVEGALNTVVHLWGYADQGDRERRRNAMAADPAWGDYLRDLGERGLLLKMENRIVRPTAFFEAFRAARRG
jgi:hypothetical protein